MTSQTTSRTREEWLHEVLTIGCQQHNRDQWRRFSDKRIASMHPEAAAFWKAHRDSLLAICKAHQANK